MACRRPRPGNDSRELALGLVGRRLAARLFVLAGDAIALARPLAEVDHLAAFAAKRPPLVLGQKRRRLAAARAGDVLYRLQKVSSKGTSDSAVR